MIQKLLENIFSVVTHVNLVVENVIQNQNGIMISANLNVKHSTREEDYVWNLTYVLASMAKIATLTNI